MTSNLHYLFYKSHYLITSCFIICTSIFLASASQADEGQCPPWINEDQNIVEKTYRYLRFSDRQPSGVGLELSIPSYFWERGVWFEMPFGYRNPWIHLPHAEEVTDKVKYTQWLGKSTYKGYDTETGQFDAGLITKGGIDGLFAFWMPSLRYVERNRWNVPHYRPCEAGRPRPSDDEYVVTFNIEWPFLPDSESSPPARRFRIAAERLAKGEPLTGQHSPIQEHNLDEEITGTKDYFIYSDDGNLVAQLYCVERRGGKPAPNPGCAGHVWERSSDLILYIRFPADRGQRGSLELWREPVQAAITLAKSWMTGIEGEN